MRSAGVSLGTRPGGCVRNAALIPARLTRHDSRLGILLGFGYLWAAVLAPWAHGAVRLRGAAAVAGAHRTLAEKAHALAVLGFEAALPTAGLDVWAHLDDAGALAPELGGAVAAVPAGAGGDGDLGRWRHGMRSMMRR